MTQCWISRSGRHYNRDAESPLSLWLSVVPPPPRPLCIIYVLLVAPLHPGLVISMVSQLFIQKQTVGGRDLSLALMLFLLDFCKIFVTRLTDRKKQTIISRPLRHNTPCPPLIFILFLTRLTLAMGKC